MKLKIQLIMAALLFSVGSNAFSAEITNEWTDDVLSHQIKVTSIDDINFSRVKGFVSVVLSKGISRSEKHLPYRKIAGINTLFVGTYIEFSPITMKNGRGTMVTTIFIPKEIRASEYVLNELSANYL